MLTATPVTLLFNGQSHYTSICGALLTIILAVVCCLVTLTTSKVDGTIASVQLNQLLQKNYYGNEDEK